ncbi:mitogen-activated protein kinase kinase kinase 18-like [Salvia miltiorrhiza]|uniref:mitogen-activated protein kinase kinase kinase 18-like n=1 Tax=Salvia miltiorrhiza TaxID=226208 RepID=UPI0025ACD324|nr:mitogen-activated protein kinase kinase kinase 18-like [Salvia miltiorrhiza]
MMAKTMRNSWLRGSCIGRGAYGTVSAAVDTATGHVFAVKSVDLGTASPSQVEALESEITILRSLSSPFIVKYLGDDTTTEGSPARNLHMEYLPAGTAADLADPGEDDVASYAWCLVSALSYLHSRGIVHCDVKGRNVLLGPSPGSAKLADLGSAMYASTAGGGVAARGSPLWMAPEAIRGERQGPESDVWSLGCTVIEMLTGKPAWDGSVCRIGYSDELPLFPTGLSAAGADFLEKCLRRDYARRWSCDQLLQHPFIAMGSRKDVADHWSPRCVLDCFSCDFHEEEQENDDDDGEIVGLERIGGLVSGAGENWESDGWLLVREQSDGGGGGGICSEYSDWVEGRTTSSSLGANSGYHAFVNSNFDFDPLYKTGEFNCSNIRRQCTQVVEILYGFVYDHLHIIIWNFLFFNLREFVDFVSADFIHLL